MQCYDCLPTSSVAVAVCVLCGKGLCREHMVRQERTVYEHVPSGMAAQVRATGRKIPRLVCKECAEGVGVSDVEGRIDPTLCACWCEGVCMRLWLSIGKNMGGEWPDGSPAGPQPHPNAAHVPVSAPFSPAGRHHGPPEVISASASAPFRL
ncbi:MAG: DUF2180 family protein, partial [Armatimonadota bacterium]|nr:DUF2180 family protein [Armatimonadota bacterium]